MRQNACRSRQTSSPKPTSNPPRSWFSMPKRPRMTEIRRAALGGSRRGCSSGFRLQFCPNSCYSVPTPSIRTNPEPEGAQDRNGGAAAFRSRATSEPDLMLQS